MAIEFVTRVVAVLDKLQIQYMVVGSFSSNVYGTMRSTRDADFVLQIGNRSVFEIVTELGGDFTLDPQMSFQTITGTSRYRILHPETGFSVKLFFLSDDPHDQARFERRLKGNIGDGQQTFVPTAEDVIITKLRWSRHSGRQKDLADAAAVVAVQAGRFDVEYVRRWCDLHGTREIFERLLQGQPKPN